MPCLEAEPESWQAVGGSFIGGTTSVSSDFRGAKPRPIPINKVSRNDYIGFRLARSSGN
jgi:hypothetical protein